MARTKQVPKTEAEKKKQRLELERKKALFGSRNIPKGKPATYSDHLEQIAMEEQQKKGETSSFGADVG